MARKRTQEEGLFWLQEICKGRGSCTSKVYLGVNKKHNFVCNCKYAWDTKPNTIHSGSWCPKCSGHERFTFERMQSFCKGRGICLANKSCKSHIKCWWHCNCGCKWKARPNNIEQGQWCPPCSDKRANRKSEPEHQIFEVIRTKYPQARNRIRGILPSKRLELDIYLELNGKKKAIEFDGPVHNPQHALFKTETMERDLRKNQECQQTGIDLVRISYCEWKKDPESIKEQVLKWIESC